jgi:hypothetical protein
VEISEGGLVLGGLQVSRGSWRIAAAPARAGRPASREAQACGRRLGQIPTVPRGRLKVGEEEFVVAAEMD